MSIQFVTCEICKTVVDANDCVVNATDNTIALEYTCKKCHTINTPTLSSEVEEAISNLELHFQTCDSKINQVVNYQSSINTIRKALQDKDSEIEDLKNEIEQVNADLGCCYDELDKTVAHPLQSKLNAIEEVVENDILISMLNEEDIHYSDISAIQDILKGDNNEKI